MPAYDMYREELEEWRDERNEELQHEERNDELQVETTEDAA